MKEPASEELDMVRECLADGRRIQAIKIYRGATGQGLKESKQYIESMIVTLLEQEPFKYEKLAHSKAGCMSVFIIGAGVTALMMMPLAYGCSTGSASLHDSRVQAVEVVNADTPEIIRILETENIASVSTAHSQVIHIQLEDGTRFQGYYNHREAGEYSEIPHLFDILNLVIHIREQREKSESLDWEIVCE